MVVRNVFIKVIDTEWCVDGWCWLERWWYNWWCVRDDICAVSAWCWKFVKSNLWLLCEIEQVARRSNIFQTNRQPNPTRLATTHTIHLTGFIHAKIPLIVNDKPILDSTFNINFVTFDILNKLDTKVIYSTYCVGLDDEFYSWLY